MTAAVAFGSLRTLAKIAAEAKSGRNSRERVSWSETASGAGGVVAIGVPARAVLSTDEVDTAPGVAPELGFTESLVAAFLTDSVAVGAVE